MNSLTNKLTKPVLLCILIASSTVGVVGCGQGSQPEDKKVEQVQTEMAGLGKAAKAAGGEFDKLSDADKEKFLGRVNGDQAAAADMVKRMAGVGGARGAGAQ